MTEATDIGSASAKKEKEKKNRKKDKENGSGSGEQGNQNDIDAPEAVVGVLHASVHQAKRNADLGPNNISNSY